MDSVFFMFISHLDSKLLFFLHAMEYKILLFSILVV